MEHRVLRLFILLIIYFTCAQQVHTENRKFTYGVVHEYPAEQDAINLAVDNSSGLNNVSVFLKRFDDIENITLFHQASVFVQVNVITIIEGSNTKTSACALSTVTGIPLIRLHENDRPTDQCEKAVQMSAGYKDYAHATLDILNTFQWKKIALVYDEGRIHEAGFFHTISQSSKLTVHFVHIYEKGEIGNWVSRAMEDISNIEPDVILLYTNRGNVELLLEEKTCLDNSGKKWILQGQVSRNLSSYTTDVVLALKLPYNGQLSTDELESEVASNYNDSVKELAAVAYDAVQVINKAVNIEPCLSINGTFITSKERAAMFTCMKKVNIDGITGPVKFSEDGMRTEVELDILNLRNNSFMKTAGKYRTMYINKRDCHYFKRESCNVFTCMRKIGTWNSTKRAVFFDDIQRNMYDASSRGSLEGKNLRVVVAMDEPFVMSEKSKHGNISFEGYCIDLLNELAEKLHFTYTLYPSPDGVYGAETTNGTWNGLVGELVNKRADVAVAALTITESREKVVDFSVPFMYYTEEMLLKKLSSNNGTVDYLQFMNPFHNEVWFATMASLVVISVAVFVFNYFSPYGYKGKNGRGTSEKFSFSNSVWFTLACMLQQGADNQPRSLSGRILAGCYWFCILIWVSTYTANLAAFFTVKNAQSPINNLNDILASSYKVAIIESGSTYEFFKTSQYDTHRKIWHRIQAEDGLVHSTPDAVKLVREKEDYVFIYDGPILRHIANQPPCDLVTVPGLSTAKGIALAFQANDPDVKDFSLAILRLHENSFLDNLKRKWWESSDGCPKDDEKTLSRKRIDLTSMLGVYAVMGIGMVLAFLVLIIEIIWKRRESSKLAPKRSNVRSIQVRPQAD